MAKYTHKSNFVALLIILSCAMTSGASSRDKTLHAGADILRLSEAYCFSLYRWFISESQCPKTRFYPTNSIRRIDSSTLRIPMSDWEERIEETIQVIIRGNHTAPHFLNLRAYLGGLRGIRGEI